MAVTPRVTSLSPLPKKITMQYNLASIVEQVTDLYIEKLKMMTKKPTPEEAQLELLLYIQQLVINENGYRPKKDQLSGACPALIIVPTRYSTLLPFIRSLDRMRVSTLLLSWSSSVFCAP